CMDNETLITSSENTSAKNKYVPVLLVVILLVILGGFYYYQTKKAANQNIMGAQTSAAKPLGIKRKMDPAMMKATTPVPLSDQQQQELTAGTSSATTDKIFTFTAGNF